MVAAVVSIEWKILRFIRSEKQSKDKAEFYITALGEAALYCTWILNINSRRSIAARLVVDLDHKT